MPWPIVGYACLWVTSSVAYAAPMTYVMDWFAVLFLLPAIPVLIASRKGRSFFTWFGYAVLLFPVALVHSLVILVTEWGKPEPFDRSVCVDSSDRCVGGLFEDRDGVIRCAHHRHQGYAKRNRPGLSDP